VKALPASEKLHALVRLTRLLGIERKEYDKAIGLLKQAEEIMKAARPKDADEAEQEEKAYRQVIIAAGDVRLWQNKPDEALTLFRRAEVLRKNPIPAQVRAARIGSYPNSLREYIDGGNFAAAIELVNEWEDSFPTDKLNGHTFYWRGKLMLLRGQLAEAIRYLERSVMVTAGAVFETEARWLLTQALEQTGKADEAKKELQRLLAIGIQDEFTKKAREKLKK
jgi:tetratricopeptide (TPR) repeat protein